MKNFSCFLIFLFLSSCKSGKYYFINNESNQDKQIEIHYVSNLENHQEVFSIPDSIDVIVSGHPTYKPYRFYKNRDKQIPLQKINDSIYQFTLQKSEKAMIRYRYYYDNSLKKIWINQEEEIWFTEVEYGNDSLTGFTTKNTKLGTTVQYEKGMLFVGDDSYIIQLR